MGDGKKLKEYLDEKGTNVRRIAKETPRYTRLFKKIPISALTLRSDLPML